MIFLSELVEKTENLINRRIRSLEMNLDISESTM
jgi:hypothetical protein